MMDKRHYNDRLTLFACKDQNGLNSFARSTLIGLLLNALI